MNRMEPQAVEQAIKPARTIAGEIAQTFRSLRHRNFRLYFFGQLVSLSGTWMQNLALSWLVYSLTKSAYWLGVVEFANLSPVLVLALAGGWVADHVDRRKVLLTTQFLLLIQASILAFLTLNHLIQLWHIIVMALVAGTIVAFEIPSRQALIVNMVERKDFVNAISLNSSLFNGSRIIGPAIAAVIIHYQGEGFCFAINAFSYLAALVAVFLLKVPPHPDAGKDTDKSVIDGLRYSFGTPEVRRLLRLTALLSLFGAQFSMLMPVVANQILHQDVQGFGALKSFAATGSLIAALSLANRGSGPMLTRSVGFAGLFFGITLCAFAVSRDFSLSLVLCLMLGFCMTFQLSGSHSLLQLSVPEQLRGRLMSVWTIMIMGLSPLGSFMVGWAASHYGAPPVILVTAVIGILSALIYLVFRV